MTTGRDLSFAILPRVSARAPPNDKAARREPDGPDSALERGMVSFPNRRTEERYGW